MTRIKFTVIISVMLFIAGMSLVDGGSFSNFLELVLTRSSQLLSFGSSSDQKKVSYVQDINSAAASNARTKKSGKSLDKKPSLWDWPNSNGTWCNAAIYEIELKCQSYVYCQNDDPTGSPDSKDGKLATISCPKNTFAAPVNVGNMPPGKVVVATCLKWDQLDHSRKQELKQDKKCILIAQKLCRLRSRVSENMVVSEKCSDE